MNHRIKKTGLLLLAAILCLSVLSACSSDQGGGSGDAASVGSFTTQDIDGNEYTEKIFQEYDLTLVNIFTSWCTPCVAEMPELEKLRSHVADKNVNVIGVILDVLDENGEINQDALKTAQQLQKKTGVQYPILLPDTTYFNGRLTGIEAFPETFFVDKNGNIVGETYSGSGSFDDWMEIVEKELAKLKEKK